MFGPMRGGRIATGAVLALAAFAGQSAGPSAPAGAVARLGTRYVLAQDIEPSTAHVQQAAKTKTGAALEEWRRGARQAALERLISDHLSSQFLKEMGLVVSEAEIQSMRAYLERSQSMPDEEISRHRAELQEQLRDPNLPPQRRESLTRALEKLQQLDKSLTESMARRQALERANPRMTESAGRKVAEETVRQWRFHRALYQKYGGRVIFQQAGFEPLGALVAFMEDCRKARRYEILDPAYAQVFSSLDQYASRPHTEVDKAHADFYFAKPWWERSEEELRRAGFRE